MTFRLHIIYKLHLVGVFSTEHIVSTKKRILRHANDARVFIDTETSTFANALAIAPQYTEQSVTTTKTNMIPNPYKRQPPSQEHHVQQTFNGNTYVFNNASFEASTFEMVMNTITKNQQK